MAGGTQSTNPMTSLDLTRYIFTSKCTCLRICFAAALDKTTELISFIRYHRSRAVGVNWAVPRSSRIKDLTSPVFDTNYLAHIAQTCTVKIANVRIMFQLPSDHAIRELEILPNLSCKSKGLFESGFTPLFFDASASLNLEGF